MKLNMNKVKKFAKETNATILFNSLYWSGPPEAPQNGLTIPFSDLGRTVDGVPFRVSLRPDEKNTLL